MPAWARFVASVAFLLFALSPAAAEKRVALVIGNDAYSSLRPEEQLLKAVNDANAVGDALERLGFEVTRGENLPRSDMLARLIGTAGKLEAGDMAFFFFAGHGVSIDGANYLLPSDIPSGEFGGEDLVKFTAVSEAAVVQTLQERGVRVAIVVIDACRDNPFAQGGTRSFGDTTRGLSRPPDQQPQGVFGLYSAGFGERALDRLGDDDADPNSVFTRVLIPALETPGQSLLDIAYVVTDEVAKLAQTIEHEQNPAYYDQARARDIVLAALPEGAEAVATETPPSGPTTPGSCAGAELHFEAAREIGRVEALEDHVRKFGACPYAALAQMLIDDLHGVAPAGSVADDTAATNGGVTEAASGTSGEDAVAAVTPGETVEARATDAAETPAETETPEAECRRLVAEVPGDKIETGPALAACRAAVGHAPDDDTLHFLLGRVHSALKDFTEAAREFRIAADSGNARAQFNLGRMYYRGDGVGIDKTEAAKWFRLAADQGHAIAQFNLALAYYHGEGVAQSLAESAKWFAAAAEQGDAESQYNLALMYFGGAGVGKDDTLAAAWFRKAADQDHANANWALGGMYYTGGGGLAKDMSEAARYLMRALKLGSEEATRELLEKRAAGFSSALRKEIQKLLTGEGAYAGAIDGSFGPGTTGALQQYASGG